jgi:hypothetical protein
VSHIFSWSSRALCCLLSGALAAGCSGTTLLPVKGQVKVGNTTLKTGSVTLVPDKDKGNNATVQPRANITEEGTFEITTDGKPGAPAGWYKVLVTADGDPIDPKDPYSLRKPLVHIKYRDIATTDKAFEVKADAPEGAYDLALSPPSSP